jgi:hypothetical protein
MSLRSIRATEYPENTMRHSRSGLVGFVMAAVLVAFAALSRFGFAQDQTAAPYKPVPITLPTMLNDPGFEGFRQQLAQIAQRKDRIALARLVAATFFWIPEDSDIADKNLSPTDNLVKALGLDDVVGWESLAAYAAEPTAAADPQRSGVFCAPAEPIYNERAADELADETQTEASDWGYPVRDGIEVRAMAKPDAPVIDKLGLYLVRVLADDTAGGTGSGTFVKVLTPSGKLGYVVSDTVMPLGGEQLCYLKETDGWKIAGLFGGESN